MTVLITGGLGVIGRRLSQRLKERGYETVVSDVRILKEDGYRRGDITQYVEMDRIFKEFKVEHVFHLAGEVGRINGEEFPRRAVDINVSGTINLAQLCMEHGARLELHRAEGLRPGEHAAGEQDGQEKEGPPEQAQRDVFLGHRGARVKVVEGCGNLADKHRAHERKRPRAGGRGSCNQRCNGQAVPSGTNT